MKQVLLFLTALCLMTVSAAAGPINYVELLKRPVAKPDHILAYGSEKDQFGELWLPAGEGPFPVVIMVHGGCWQSSLPGVELMSQIAQDLKQNNIAVWNLEYRRLGTKGSGYPGTFQDIANGADYLRGIADTYHLDLNHVITLGHSAGGHLAMWLAGRGRIDPQSALFTKDPLPLKAAISLAGINDLESFRAQGPMACGGPATIDGLIDARNRTDAYKDTSPAAMLPLGIPQTIIYGDLDPIVPLVFASDYAAKAKALGDTVNILPLKDAGHFELIDPQSAAWPDIRKTILEKLQ